MAVTLGAILEKARNSLRAGQGRRIDDSEIIDDINEAVRAVIRKVAVRAPDYYMRSAETQLATSNITAATANYDLPASFFVDVLVTTTDSDADTTERDRLTLERTLDSDADGYYLRNNDIYLYPTPDASVTNGLNIYYVPQHADITNIATALPLADDFQDAYVEWGVVKGTARQQGRTADFGSVFSMIESQLDFITANVNRPDDQGITVLWRDWL